MASTGAFLAMGTAVVGVNAAIKAFQKFNLAKLFTSGHTLALLGVAGGIAAIAGYVAAYREETTAMQREVDELTASAREMDQVIADAGAAYDETAASTQAAADVAAGYVDKLRAIEAAGMKTDEQQQEYQNTLALLLQTMPELSNCISQTTDEYGRTTYALEGSTGALLQNIEAVKKNAMAQAMQERLTAVYGNYSDVLIEAQKNSIGLTDAKDRLNTANKKYSDTLEELSAVEEKARKEYEHFDTVIYPERYYELKEALSEAGDEVQQAEEDVRKYEQTIESGNKTIADAEEEIALLNKTVQNISSPLQQAEEEADNMARVLEAVQAEAAELAKSYQETYEAAQESIRGQYSLWDDLPDVAAKSVADITKQLREHQKYWADHEKNLDTILSHAGEFEGLNQVVSDLAGDYSENSVNTAAGIAEALESGSVAGVQEMIEVWRDLQHTMTDTTTKTTEIAEDMPGQLANLRDTIERAIQDMDQSDEAYEVAMGIALAFADGASDQSPTVQAAYEAMALNAVNAAMKTSFKRFSDLNSARISASMMNVPGMNGYASGTDSAPPGWAWVGEEGPELMRLRGGEQILPSSVSQEAMQAYNDYRQYRQYSAEYQAVPSVQESARPPLEVVQTVSAGGAPKVEMHFHIEAGAQPETVDAWRDYASRG